MRCGQLPFVAVVHFSSPVWRWAAPVVKFEARKLLVQTDGVLFLPQMQELNLGVLLHGVDGGGFDCPSDKSDLVYFIQVDSWKYHSS
jgi:hypothetical protein